MFGKRFIATLICFTMIFSMIVQVSADNSPHEITLPSTMSYTANVGTGQNAMMDGYPNRPYAISWALGGTVDQYRVGYIGFDVSELELGEDEIISSAILNLTISRTQNVNQSDGPDSFGIFATDYNSIYSSGNAIGMPERGSMLAYVTLPSSVPEQQSNLAIDIPVELDLSNYFKEYPESEGIGLYITNRDDVPIGTHALIGFYGYNEAYAPKITLTISKKASADIYLKAGDEVLDSFFVDDLLTGKTYTLSDDEAPKYIIKDEKIYLRENANEQFSFMPVDLTNDVIVNYNEVTIEEIKINEQTIYVGGKVKLPTYVKTQFSDGQILDLKVDWNKDEALDAEDKIGESYINGTVLDFNENVKLKVTVKDFVPSESIVTNNGGWNWYVEPSGTHIQPGDTLAQRFENDYATNNGYKFKYDRTYMGWVEDNGSVVVSQYDHDTGEHKRVVIHDRLEPDDHNNPAVIVLPDGRIMAWYSAHTNEPYMYYRVTKNPEDISQWHEGQYYYCRTDTVGDYATYNATYPTALVVNQGGKDGEDRIYLFWRGVHWQPTNAQFTLPDENGKCKVIMGQTQFANTAFSDGGKRSGYEGTLRPYSKYDYDYDRGIIHVTFTYTHPDNAAQNAIYYVYLNIADQGIYTAKGHRLQDIPFENQDIYNMDGLNQKWGIVVQDLVPHFPELVVFDPKGEARRGWTWDIKANDKGEPCIVYADITDTPPGEDESLPDSFPDTWEDRSHHYYWYARWDSESQEWKNTFLTYGGKWFHENATQERCYSGGLTLDHNAKDANVVFLAKPTIGKYGNIFEIYRYESPDNGETWPEELQTPITQNSKINNARPNVIYNYKQSEDGTHLGPRLLWIRGEYRYWMNYEYKTGVVTDYPGIETQDDPEMKADAFLTVNGGEIEKLSKDLENEEFMARFRLSNISIGDGNVMVGIAHYDKDNKLKKIVTDNVIVPGRSVPQYPVQGAPKGREEGTYSNLGSEEIETFVSYVPENIEDGDRISLLAYSMGKYKMLPIISIPYEITTEGNRYLIRDQISYDGEEMLKLGNGVEFNGWKASLNKENTSYEPSFGERNYVAVTRAPFGNTALHLYHGTTSRTTGDPNGAGAVMVSHALPEIDEDYEIKFNIRWINELNWSYPSTAYAGFSLSNGTPFGNSDLGENPTAYQFRHIGQDGGTNGRRGRYVAYDSITFGEGNTWDAIVWVDGVVGNNSDKLMEGALFDVRIIVRPSQKIIETYVYDGYRTGYFSQSYNGIGIVDWDVRKINNITFNSSIGYNSEIVVDDFRVSLLRDEVPAKVLPEGEKLNIKNIYATQGLVERAIDENEATFWSGTTTKDDPTPELVVDLGKKYNISKIGILPGTSGIYYTYDIYVSKDGKSWDRVFRGNTNNTKSWEYRSGQHKEARYVKLRTNGNSSYMTFNLAEIEVWGY